MKGELERALLHDAHTDLYDGLETFCNLGRHVGADLYVPHSVTTTPATRSAVGNVRVLGRRARRIASLGLQSQPEDQRAPASPHVPADAALGNG